MGFLDPKPVPYDAVAWRRLPLHERGRLVCQAWALDGYGTPIAVYLVYALKVAFYIGVWIAFCTMGEHETLANIGSWWLSGVAFQKAVLWSMAFEGLGLGCGSGPLTGRYFPPVGGALHFLRPGTTKLSMVPRVPWLGGIQRTWLDVALYVALMGTALWALLSPQIRSEQLWALAILVPLVGLGDKTVFLALRAEHYWVTILCFVFAGEWIAGAKAVQLALWFWAGFSKLNHHFPTVVCVMTSNGPLTRIPWLRRLMYQRYPDDLRPSKLAQVMGHAGTALEMLVPLVLVFAPGGWSLLLGMALMLMLHAYITSNVPMGVPIEWNFMVVYGGFALFWAHPEIAIWDLGSWPLGLFLAFTLVALPLLGNFFPRSLSFLLSMRYYAGNWAYGVWLFRGESHDKLRKLVKTAPWVYEQLDRFYDRPTSYGLVGKVMAFRLMHLHGRALPVLLPKAVPDLNDYEYLDGEIVAGMVLGWNFGDGHLHNERLLAAVQAQCGFEEGELRCVFVESQPLGSASLAYRIHDAKTGLIEAGELDVAELRERQPWEAAL